MIRIIWLFSLLFSLCLSLPAKAQNLYAEDNYLGLGGWYTSTGEICSALESKENSGKTTYPCEFTGIDYRQVRINGQLYYNKRYVKAVLPVAGASNPTLYYYEMGDVTPCAEGETFENGQCIPPDADPTECYEQGLAYDSQTKQCTEVCENGELSGVCLNPTPDNEDTCNSESPDYKGYLGNGNNRQNICTSDMQCEGGQFGLVNGIPACIPDEYGPPECGSVDVIAYDQYGWVCETPQGNPNPDPEPDPTPEPGEPNTDTDGDGEPDEYRRENDPLANAKAQDKTNQELAKANKELQKSNQNLDRIYGGVKDLVDQGEQRDQEVSDSTDLVNNNTSDVGNLDDPNLVLGDEGEVNLLDELGNYQDVPDPHVGQCPEPREIVLSLGTYQISWQPWCDFASTLYPFTLFMFSFIGVAAIARTAIR